MISDELVGVLNEIVEHVGLHGGWIGVLEVDETKRRGEAVHDDELNRRISLNQPTKIVDRRHELNVILTSAIVDVFQDLLGREISQEL